MERVPEICAFIVAIVVNAIPDAHPTEISWYTGARPPLERK